MVDSNHIRFVHYTRAEAAMKILKSKQVWMRKSMCMNDYMEVLHGIRYLEDIFTSKLGDRFKFVLNGLFPDLALKMETMFVNSKLKLLTDTYITCVSEHNSGPEDVYGRLSMWRAYGGNSGVALVMNNAPFLASEPSDSLAIQASPVAYVGEDGFKEAFEQVVGNIENDAEFLRKQSQQTIEGYLFRMLAFAAVCAKHAGFEEELEWRVVHCPWWWSVPSAPLTMEIEEVNGAPQPVYKISLNNAETLPMVTVPALIDRIIIGPTRDPIAMKEAFEVLLDKAGVGDAGKRVFVSNIPLRQ